MAASFVNLPEPRTLPGLLRERLVGFLLLCSSTYEALSNSMFFPRDCGCVIVLVVSSSLLSCSTSRNSLCINSVRMSVSVVSTGIMVGDCVTTWVGASVKFVKHEPFSYIFVRASGR